jgi:hypothetical protein
MGLCVKSALGKTTSSHSSLKCQWIREPAVHDRKKKKGMETTFPGQLLILHSPFLNRISSLKPEKNGLVMPNIPLRLSFACRYCGQMFDTSKGRSNHLSQFKSCHEQLLKASSTRPQLK